MGQTRPCDILICPDGSCGLCHLSVDGVKKLACQTPIHSHMSIHIQDQSDNLVKSTPESTSMLCPCLNVSQEMVSERLKQGKLQSPEAVISVTHIGEGKCHGQLCMAAFKRILQDEGMDVSQWIDWRFPWSDWVLTPSISTRKISPNQSQPKTSPP